MEGTKNANALEKPEIPKQPRPPLTLGDIGEAPPLMNTGDPRSGKRVRLTVLAIPFPPETQDDPKSDPNFGNPTWKGTKTHAELGIFTD